MGRYKVALSILLAQWVYWIVLISASVLGLVEAVRNRTPFQGITSVLTLFAWPIVLSISILAGGIY